MAKGTRSATVSRRAEHLDERLVTMVGDASAKELAKRLDLHTAGDLLRHLPRRYETPGEFTTIADLKEGQDVTILAEVRSVQSRSMKSRRGSIQTVVVTDGHDDLTLTFFNQKHLQNTLKPGTQGIFIGKVSSYMKKRQLTQPNYTPATTLLDGLDLASEEARERANSDEAKALAKGRLDKLIPIYPATAKMPTWKISASVRLLLDQVREMPDPVPDSVLERRELPTLKTAAHWVHRPESWGQINEGRRRFRYEEAFVLQAELARRRLEARALPATPRSATAGGLVAAFDERLPFDLTDGQRGIGEEIRTELARTFPMHRLLQGEVGSGKTVVALRAMLAVVDAGGQAALLAPTEVLAAQHYRSIRQLLGPLAERDMLGGAEHATSVRLLTGSLGAKARREAMLDVASGQAGLVIGTHALLEEKVDFADLGLVVVDEQHRFGVEQRAALTSKAGGTSPHLLVMTATPIPRTVAMTVFGDLAVSTLRELPRGRAEVQTNVVPLAEHPTWIDRVWQRIREEVEKGHQAYVVCPRIGEDGATDGEEEPPDPEAADGEEKRRATAVIELMTKLSEGPLSGLRIGLLHGRLPADDKDATMRRFAAGELDVLVATTVIEVGVDVPNASTMVIVDADWFGASQLHQLRGRIGRGDVPGLCLLVTEAPDGNPARERLDAVASTRDGFELSRRDLEQRREGDVLGAEQSGRRSSLRALAVLRDEDLIEQAREDATEVVEADPELAGQPTLAGAVAALTDDERTMYLDKS